KVQEKILEEDVDKMVNSEDEEYYASAFADSVFQDNEDTVTRYLEDHDHIHFSLCGGTETEDKTLARASV
ncbi:hypothetical protein Tco_1286853, partial [Tanacetum coccineum]